MLEKKSYEKRACRSNQRETLRGAENNCVRDKKYIKKYIPQKQTLSAQCVTQELNIDT